MSAHAEPVHDHGHDHHGPPPANQSSRLDPATLGMFLFIASEAMLFGAFFTAYFFVRVVNPDAPATWPPEPYEFPVFVATVNTAILVTSSFTIHWATQSIKRGDRNGLKAGLVLTILLGLAFLLTQASSTPRRLQHGRRRLRLGLLRAHRAARRPRLRRPDPARWSSSRASGGTSRPTTTTASRSPGSTGTSST